MNYKLYDFGERLTKLRKDKGLSQSKLANKVGINPSAIGAYEQGKMYPSIFNLCELASALNVTVGDLVGEEGNENRNEVLLNCGYSQGILDTAERIKRLIDEEILYE